MAERPILFSGPLVRAILAGRKTETRRMMKPQPKRGEGGRWYWPCRAVRSALWLDGDQDILQYECPVGGVGDVLWVRETWTLEDDCGEVRSSLVGRTTKPQGTRLVYRADGEQDIDFWRPSIHMPRWAARIFLRVTDVRAERLQSLDESGARSEGVQVQCNGCGGCGPASCVRCRGTGRMWPWPNDSARDEFARIWDSIYGGKPDASWGADPWVWVVKFEREEPTP